jgi:DNA-binding IclR family transcriptional regulator
MDGTPSDDQPSDGTGALHRALRILRVLAHSSPMGSRLSEIAAAADLPPSTAHRLLKRLAAEGMVLRETGGRRLYKLGPFALGLGPDGAAHPYGWLAEICRPAMEKLAARTGHAVQATVRIGRSGVSLAMVEGTAPPHPAFAKAGTVGFMGYGSASVVLLAALPDAQIEEILWENDWLLRQSAIRRDRLETLVAQARRQGFSYSEREFVPDLCALSVCIPTAQGTEFAALSLLVRAERIASDEQRRLVAELRRTADGIARQAERHRDPG